MKELLLKALDRIDNIQHWIITWEKEMMRESGIQELIDSSDIRKELEAIEKDNIAEVDESCHKYDNYDSEWDKAIDIPDTLTNSQITAMCIKAGITDTDTINWIKKRESDEDNSIESISQSIQYVLKWRK